MVAREKTATCVLHEPKGKAGMAAVPAARRVKAILRRLPLGSDDVNKSLSGVRLGERQTESVSPLFSPR